MNSLKNICVLVTRPRPAGEVLCEKIQALGGATVYLPTIEFASLPQAEQQLDQYDWIIFISQEAVERSISFLGSISKKTRIAAMGETTANALQAAGMTDVVYPLHEWTSEGLLDLAFFKKVDRQKILLVRGEGGRELLSETLMARGAQVDHLPVYRRQMPVYASINPYLELLRQKKIDVVVCTSGESLHNLMTIIGVENQSLLVEIKLIVVSQRLVALAKEYHFQQVFQAKNASHHAIISSLEDLVYVR